MIAQGIKGLKHLFGSVEPQPGGVDFNALKEAEKNKKKKKELEKQLEQLEPSED